MSVNSCARSARHSTIAAAPSSGAQNMYWVSGSLTMRDSRICSTDIGVRRNAFSLSAPLPKFFAATRASVVGLMS